jgi:hypothetical protein
MVTRMSEDTIEGCLHGGNRWGACATPFERREVQFKARIPSIVHEQGQERSGRTIHG